MRIGILKAALAASVSVALVAACSATGSGGMTSDGVKTGRGVDAASKVITIGGLYDLSGPLAGIGVPWEAAAQAAVKHINESGRLGEWKIRYITKDHAFNPSNSVAAYEEIKEDVLMIVPSLGAQPTAPLLPRFAADNMLSFVGSGSGLAQTSHSMWGFTTYRYEAMRAVDHARAERGDSLRLGIVYTNDDSGEDSRAGARAAAAALGVQIVEEVPIEVTSRDFSAAVGRLESAGVTDVVLATGAGLASGVVGTASARGYKPQWYGNMNAFLEAAWYGTLEPEAWEDNFYWVHGLPYWGEDRPGMAEFIEAYEGSAAAKDHPAPQMYALLAYLQVQQMGAILEAAIAAGDLTPEGVYAAAESLGNFDANGLLLAPVDPLGGPDAMKVTRVLAPDVANKTWTVVGDVKEISF